MEILFERRRHPRVQVDLAMYLEIDDALHRGILRNISKGGLSIDVPVKLRLADEVSVQFRVMPNIVCRARGRVVRKSGSCGFAVHFDFVSPELDHFIDDLLAMRESLWSDFIRNVASPTLEVRSLAPIVETCRVHPQG